MKSGIRWMAALIALATVLSACGAREQVEAQEIVPESRPVESSLPAPVESAVPAVEEPSATQEPSVTEEPPATQKPSVTEEPSATQEPPVTEEPSATQEPPVTEEPSAETPGSQEQNGFLVVIDAGHQAKGNSEKEPIGPGATEMKAKVAGGTKGCVSGLHEYELTLAVSEKLQAELEARGYTVIMVRTDHNVNISNAERAEIANDAKADVFIRIHANGSENSAASGAETLCQTASNPYNGSLHEQSRALAEDVLDGLVNATGAKKRKVVETDTMSGINWCQVPVTIVEMGFMTNEAEDKLMASEEYQQKLAAGMADGIDAYRCR